MHRPIALVLLLALLLTSACATGRPAVDAPLPADPRLVTGRLDNGLSYVIRRHPTAERRIGVWLHVATGSLNETEETRGLAHYLEHLAFNGSAHFPPGALVPFFEQLGLTFGRDQNAFTSFDQTTYQVMAPAGQPETLDKALLFLADVASRLTLSPAEIESERRVILEEKRARAGAAQRVNEQVLPRLVPESTLGRRLPIGTEATIRSLAPSDFREYYRRWYVPSNMTLLVVGDGEPAEIVTLIGRHFGDAPAVPRPEPRPVGVVTARGSRAILATDPELTRAEVSLIRVEPARPPATTVAEYRRDLVETVAAWTLRRRLETEAAEGRGRFENAGARVGRWAGVMRTISVLASGPPAAWQAMLADLGRGLQRARLHGVTEREVEDARTALLAQAREAVVRDATAPVRQVLSALNRAVADQAPMLSPEQRLALLERLLPGMGAEEVSMVLGRLVDPADAVAVVELPPAPGLALPAEAEVARLARAAVEVTPEAAPERARATALLAALPRPGTIVERQTEPATQVTSLWLGNGVRAHHRHMTQRRGQVLLVATLAGGTIEEQAGTRGLTEAAAQAWARPASGRLSSTGIRDVLVGRRVAIAPKVGEDAVTLTLRTTPADLETAFQLLHLLLTDPVVEAVALEQWRQEALRDAADRRAVPMAALREVAADALRPPAEPRMRPLGPAEVTAVTRESAQAWLHRLVTHAPLEIAVVGDVDAATASALVARYVGALPSRARIGPETLASLRQVPPVPGPIRVAHSLPTRTPQAAVLVGFRGADARDRRDARLLTIAARVLSTRMHRTLREERQLVYSVHAASRPALAYPGYGAFIVQAPTDPARAGALATEIEAMYAHFATEGPTEAEAAVARRQIRTQLDEQLERPGFWAMRLASTHYRGESPQEPLEARRQYEEATAHDVQETFRRYAQPGAGFTIVVTPDEIAAPLAPPGS